MPNNNEAVCTAQKQAIPKGTNGAQNGPAEFEMSGAKIEQRITEYPP